MRVLSGGKAAAQLVHGAAKESIKYVLAFFSQFYPTPVQRGINTCEYTVNIDSFL